MCNFPCWTVPARPHHLGTDVWVCVRGAGHPSPPPPPSSPSPHTWGGTLCGVGVYSRAGSLWCEWAMLTGPRQSPRLTACSVSGHGIPRGLSPTHSLHTLAAPTQQQQDESERGHRVVGVRGRVWPTGRSPGQHQRGGRAQTEPGPERARGGRAGRLPGHGRTAARQEVSPTPLFNLSLAYNTAILAGVTLHCDKGQCPWWPPTTVDVYHN